MKKSTLTTCLQITNSYFPIQKSLNTTSSISSTPTFPVTCPSCWMESLSSSADKSKEESKHELSLVRSGMKQSHNTTKPKLVLAIHRTFLLGWGESTILDAYNYPSRHKTMSPTVCVWGKEIPSVNPTDIADLLSHRDKNSNSNLPRKASNASLHSVRWYRCLACVMLGLPANGLPHLDIENQHGYT